MKVKAFLKKINDLLKDGRISPDAYISIKISYIGSAFTFDQSDFILEESMNGMTLNIIPDLEEL